MSKISRRSRTKPQAVRTSKLAQASRARGSALIMWIFSTCWFLFGIYSIWYGVTQESIPAQRVGGIISGLSFVLLLRGFWLWVKSRKEEIIMEKAEQAKAEVRNPKNSGKAQPKQDNKSRK